MLVLVRGTLQLTKQMKRYSNLYEKIIDIENLRLADAKARRGKAASFGIKYFDRNRESNFSDLHKMLLEKGFKNSKYKVFTVYEPKKREIYQLPYFPDRIMHHAIMNVLEPIWCSLFISQTYSCIKGRGIHKGMKDVKAALRHRNDTKYCLKIDISKYYMSIDHDILKAIIRKKIKCVDTLNLLDEIIDSAPGVPIGNYLSQFFANIYLSYFDHFVKEVLKIRHYFRYADDIVVLYADKDYLHSLLVCFNNYFENELNIGIKRNYSVSPVADGVDFLGFVFYHTHIKMRKRIKKNFAKKIALINKQNLSEKDYLQCLCGWLGWAKYSNSRNFINKNIKHEMYERILRTTTKGR